MKIIRRRHFNDAVKMLVKISIVAHKTNEKREFKQNKSQPQSDSRETQTDKCYN